MVLSMLAFPGFDIVIIWVGGSPVLSYTKAVHINSLNGHFEANLLHSSHFVENITSWKP